MLIDLHAHTWPLSDDSFLSPDDLIRGAKRAGLDGICLTEHDFAWDPRKVKELCEKHNFLVMAGMEVNTEDGHMLVFGLDRYVYGIHRIKELAQMVDEVGGAIIASHPYRRQMPFWLRDGSEYREALERASRNSAYQHVHGLEAVNGRGSQRENHFSRELCVMMDLPGVGGTDSHAQHDIGRCATYFEAAIGDVHDLAAAIRAGHFHPVTLRVHRVTE